MNKKKLYKPKKCKICESKFRPFQSLQKICSPKCASDYVTQQNAKKARTDNRKRKRELKTTSQILQEAQRDCNKLIRVRDKDEGCISCDKGPNWGGQWHASHYRPAGSCASLRFHPMNIHKACSECNSMKSGNLTEYRIRLEKKIGRKNLEWLESQNRPYKYTRNEALEIKKYFKEQNKLLDSNAVTNYTICNS